MKTLRGKQHRALLISGLVLLMILAGCAKAKLRVLTPAEINTVNIQTVAVGSFQIGGIREKFKSERNGGWITHEIALTAAEKQAISRAVRSRVINLLTTTPYFKVSFSDEFASMENDTALQQLVSTKGYKTQDIDAVINGKIWLDIERTDGADINKVELSYIEPSQDPERQMDLGVEQLIWWPYKSERGTLALEIKLTRLNPTEVVAVTFDTRSYAHRIGGIPAGLLDQASGALSMMGGAASADADKTKKIESADEVLPSFDQMVADLSMSIAAAFVKKIAVTEKVVSYPIATGGDANTKVLIEAGAYDLAIEKLQNITATEPLGDDLYNLGLCFEAKGDFGLALNFYRDAFKQDSTNLLYAQGIGRLERLQREYPALRKQLR
ncbi:MAG: hypothetical protein HQM11_00080 [SAR324 cluster bacterium]|nr:hypothetical protein [SAR324 cluster bacterium]